MVSLLRVFFFFVFLFLFFLHSSHSHHSHSSHCFFYSFCFTFDTRDFLSGMVGWLLVGLASRFFFRALNDGFLSVFCQEFFFFINDVFVMGRGFSMI
jgi:hypothetical protein